MALVAAKDLTTTIMPSQKENTEFVVTELSDIGSPEWLSVHNNPTAPNCSEEKRLEQIPESLEVQDAEAPVDEVEGTMPSNTSPEQIPKLNIASDRHPSGATKLRKMLEETDELIVCPGVYDGLSARTAHEVGFNALYMTGAGTMKSRLGQPDLGIAHLHDMRANAEMIANLDPCGPPLIADMDTGYEGPIIVARTVEEYIRAGVAGAHLEDQILTKRCGHLGDKKVVSQDEYFARLRAAHGAREKLKSDFVLIARTDALQTLGYDECITRLKEAREIGFDVGLLEDFTSKEQAAQAVKDLAPWPVLLNMVENGITPLITVDEARAIGFRIMIFSFCTLAPAYVAIKETLIRLKEKGVVGTPKDLSPRTLFEICGLEECMEVDLSARSQSFAEGVEI